MQALDVVYATLSHFIYFCNLVKVLSLDCSSLRELLKSKITCGTLPQVSWQVSKNVGNNFIVFEHIDLNETWAKLTSGNLHLEGFCFAHLQSFNWEGGTETIGSVNQNLRNLDLIEIKRCWFGVCWDCRLGDSDSRHT